MRKCFLGWVAPCVYWFLHFLVTAKLVASWNIILVNQRGDHIVLGLYGVCCNTSRWSCQAVLAVQTGVCGWALWCNNKHPLTIVLCIFFELLASACHMPHMIEHCLLLCPVFIMLVYQLLWIKNRPSCCWLHFELYFAGRLWYFQSILWHLPSGS